MLTEKNFAAALKVMGFVEKSKGIYEKIFDENISMSANLLTKKLTYPTQLQNRDRNNFFDAAHKENFVVFECVNRLLDKGYKPEDITLEKAWSLGHTSKSGRADICVAHGEKVLLIIECKTFGKEFNHELENLKHDGGQLFSYRQQENSCEWLVLYASTLEDNKIIFDAASVSCHETAYKNASNVQDFFRIWKEIFQKKIVGDVIFHDETVAYKIGVVPFRKKDLTEFRDTSIVNKLEEILRHNNVSDKENAFNRILALLICKLADETHKDDNQEVDFQFKFGVDTYETFQDRLQRLYHQGMEEFMREPITYIPLAAIDELFFQTKSDSRDVLKSLIKEKFRAQKFFTNNDFAFMDVHNEELFYKNGKILIEVVNLFKDYRFIGVKNLQTLGDLFEQLLDRGFKQNEGQFFTPLPITRFIWDALPLEEIISVDNKITPPKIIDYACGAGHFLTQGFEAINDFFARKNIEPPKFWEDEKIFGVEKDYRLARVSKISLFMHGADKGKIKFGDGLENYADEGFTPATFDVLVSNPPYSVKGFKQHLNLKHDFDTLEKISNDGSEIETLFVERIAQLLKAGGIAAVILPSSILNKDGKSFVSAREKILQTFYVRAIAEFGSKTFSATGTKTNILFLQKISDPPEKFKLFADTVNGIFSSDFGDAWDNEKIFAAWLSKINVTADAYKKFIARAVYYTYWQGDTYFGEYVSVFVEKVTPPKNFKSDDEKIAWLNQKFYDFAQDVEREKLHYFAMTCQQTTLIISAPDDNREQENFLGYTWSNRKGDEGIKVKSAGGLLYDPNNRRADDRLAAAVRRSFYGEEISIPDAQDYFYYLNLADMINFSGIDFTKKMTMSRISEEKIKVQRLFPTSKLGSLVDVNLETFDQTTTPEEQYFYVDIGAVDAATNKIDFSNVIFGASAPSRARRIAHDHDVLISTVRPYLKSFAIVVDAPKNTLYSTGFAILSSKDENVISNEFIFCLFLNDPLLMNQMKSKMSKGSYPSINQSDINGFYILIPPIDEQKKIVEEFRAVDDEISAQEKIIAACDDEIKSKFDEMFGGVAEKIFVGDCCEIEKGTTLTREQAIAGDVPVVAGGILPSCYHNVANREKNVITISASGNAGYVNFWRVPIFATDCNTLKNKNNFAIEFVYCALKNIQEEIYRLRKGSVQPHVYGKDIAKIKIPNPPFEMQEEFASYVKAVDARQATAQIRLEELKAAREKLVEKYFR